MNGAFDCGVEGKREGACALRFEAETTSAGEQSLVPGVRPIRLADRLRVLAEAPLAPTRPQRPADFGLFDMNARNQLDLFAPPASSRTGDHGAAEEQRHGQRPNQEQ